MLTGGDGQLLNRCRCGDEAAWRQVYEDNVGLVGRFLLHLLGRTSDLDDIVQQVFVEFFQSLDKFRGEARLSTWLFGIASRVASKHIRTEHRWRRRRQAIRDAVDMTDIFNANSPLREADAREALRTLHEALYSLDIEHRGVWIMREVEGMTTRGVAEALGIPPGTVRSRLFHARRQILQDLTNRERRPE